MVTHDLYGPPKVGGDILSYCTRCKMDLAHVISSMLNGLPARVICKTCKSQHNHKNPKSGTSLPLSKRLGTGSTKKPSVSHPKASGKITQIWEEKMKENQSRAVLSYRPQETFQAGDVLQHTQFGMGVVEEVKGNGKIVVLFRDDQKVLVHSLK